MPPFCLRCWRGCTTVTILCWCGALDHGRVLLILRLGCPGMHRCISPPDPPCRAFYVLGRVDFWCFGWINGPGEVSFPSDWNNSGLNITGQLLDILVLLRGWNKLLLYAFNSVKYTSSGTLSDFTCFMYAIVCVADLIWFLAIANFDLLGEYCNSFACHWITQEHYTVSDKLYVFCCLIILSWFSKISWFGVNCLCDISFCKGRFIIYGQGGRRFF